MMDRYNVIWDTPSKDSSGSMPLGNGDIGVNAWVEENGDLVFYISKTDAWNENASLLKLGRVRMRFFTPPQPFRQVLRLREGDIEIQIGHVVIHLWVDANQPAIRVEAESSNAFAMLVGLEVWRDKPRELTGSEAWTAYGLDGGPEPIIQEPDTILPPRNNRLVWLHRNPKSAWATSLKHQGLGEWMSKAKDPILHRTFGGAIGSQGLIAENPTTLKSPEARKRFLVTIYPLTSQTETVEAWLTQLDDQIARVEKEDLEHARTEHRRWWADFWDRSWIRVTGCPEADVVSQGYALQRFISACGGRGGYPIKFNGSIFTVDAREPEYQYDADYRCWGGPYWFQNTRLIYWPMMASGDLDLIKPFFEMYLNALPMAKCRTRLYFGHDGAFFPETMEFWGAYASGNYGWNREGKPVSHCDNTYIHYYWSGALELVTIMLDYHSFTQDSDFLRTALVPIATEVVRFYDQHYSRDEQGKLRLNPINCLEMWHDSVNPLPDIAGLKFILPQLLSLPDLDAALRSEWRRVLGDLPQIPMRQVDGKTMILPAQECIGPTMNSENPELYAIFPYRLFGVGKPDLETARLTYERRVHKHNAGWQQETIQAALLGLAEEAGRMVAERFANKHPGSRFPAFWGRNYDWIPDQDHGCVAMMALQSMLLQAEGRELRLLPAWPKGWDVEFKLHAPGRTIVEGVYRGGQWERLAVSPEDRRADIV